MRATKLTDKELIKENRRLIKNLSARIANIEGLGATAPQYAVNKYRELEKTLPTKLSALDRKELLNIYRDLRYILSLKSSSVKGAKHVQKNFEPIKRALETLSPAQQEKFWEIYGKIYEKTSGSTDKFKYTVMYSDIDLLFLGQDPDKIVQDIIGQYDETLEELGRSATDENVRVLFTQKLQSLLK